MSKLLLLYSWVYSLISLLLLISYTPLNAVEGADNSSVDRYYFSYGLNGSRINNNDIRVTNPEKGHDFTLFNAEITDGRAVPANIGDTGDYQFQIRLGRELTSNWDIELSLEHNKYILKKQNVRVKGLINGIEVDQVMKVGSYLSLLQLEHTDGFNHITVNLIYKIALMDSNKDSLESITSLGIGKIVLVTGSTLFGEKKDDGYHIAGNTYSGSTGLRQLINDNCFVQSVLKVYFTDVVDAELAGGSRAAHQTVSQTLQFEIGCYFGGTD